MSRVCLTAAWSLYVGFADGRAIIHHEMNCFYKSNNNPYHLVEVNNKLLSHHNHHPPTHPNYILIPLAWNIRSFQNSVSTACHCWQPITALLLVVDDDGTWVHTCSCCCKEEDDDDDVWLLLVVVLNVTNWHHVPFQMHHFALGPQRVDAALVDNAVVAAAVDDP